MRLISKNADAACSSPTDVGSGLTGLGGVGSGAATKAMPFLTLGPA